MAAVMRRPSDRQWGLRQPAEQRPRRGEPHLNPPTPPTLQKGQQEDESLADNSSQREEERGAPFC